MTRWFNYHAHSITLPTGLAIPSGIAQPLVQGWIDPRWEDYTFHIRDLARAPTNQMIRCLLGVSDSLARSVPAPFGVPLLPQCELVRQLNYRMLVPSRDDGTVNWGRVVPLNIADLPLPDGPIARFLKALYRSDKPAYIIIQCDSTATSLPDVSGYQWQPLREVFGHLFHSLVASSRSCYWHIYESLDAYNCHFDTGDPLNDIPHDFFIVGLKGRGDSAKASKWEFCLGAKLDAQSNMVELEIASYDLHRDRFALIGNFVSDLLSSRT